jgi:hypothetical protein
MPSCICQDMGVLSSRFQLMMGRNSNVFQAGRGPLTTKGRQIIGFGAYHPPPGPWARPVPTSPVRTYLLQAMYVFLLHGTVDNIIYIYLSLWNVTLCVPEKQKRKMQTCGSGTSTSTSGVLQVWPWSNLMIKRWRARSGGVTSHYYVPLLSAESLCACGE